MKCFVCKKEIKDERQKVLLNQDGDFACNENCRIRYEKEREEFFNNIGNDAWYKNYMG